MVEEQAIRLDVSRLDVSVGVANHVFVYSCRGVIHCPSRLYPAHTAEYFTEHVILNNAISRMSQFGGSPAQTHDVGSADYDQFRIMPCGRT